MIIFRQKIWPLLLILMMLVVVMVPAGAADATDYSHEGDSAQPIRHIEHNNHINNQVSASASISFMGAVWSDSRQCWEFNYRFVGMSHSYDRYNLFMTGMEVEVLQNQNNVGVWVSDDPKYVGFVPATENNIDYAGVALATVGFALSVLDTPLSFVWSAITFVQDLGNALGSSTTDPDFIRKNSQQNMWVDDMGQFLWFIIDVEPNQSTEFAYRYATLGNRFELMILSGTRVLSAGSTDGLNMNPTSMSPSELNRYSIQSITREQVLNSRETLGISQNVITNFLLSGDSTLYYTDSFIEYGTSCKDSGGSSDRWRSDVIEMKEKMSALSCTKNLNDGITMAVCEDQSNERVMRATKYESCPIVLNT